MSQMGHSRRFPLHPQLRSLACVAANDFKGHNQISLPGPEPAKLSEPGSSHRHDRRREAADEQPLVQRLS